MPTVSQFFGISIYIYYDDHGAPHFHALYGDDEVVVLIEDLTIRDGKLPPRALGLVVEWAALHRHELLEVWHEARAHKPLSRIEPLR